MWKVLTCRWSGRVFIRYLPPQAHCLLSAVPRGLQLGGWNICSYFNGAWNTTEEPSFLRWNPLPRATSLLFHFRPFGIHIVDIGKCCLFERASPLPILSLLTPVYFLIPLLWFPSSRDEHACQCSPPQFHNCLPWYKKHSQSSSLL